MENNRQKLKQIIRKLSILKGDFTLSSGKKSDYYIDARLTTLDAEGVDLIATIFLEEISGDARIRKVGGPTLGADPIIGALLALSWEREVPYSGFIVRKQAKGHGTGKLIEGNVREGDHVAIVEDVITSGGSVLKAVKAVEDAGATVIKVLCVVDREEGAKEKFIESGYEFFSIFSISQLL